MVYDKVHDSTHLNAQKLDEHYALVEKGMEVLNCFYKLQEYIVLCEDQKFDLYDFLNQDYEYYVNACDSNVSKRSSESSYYTASSGSPDSMETNYYSD